MGIANAKLDDERTPRRIRRLRSAPVRAGLPRPSFRRDCRRLIGGGRRPRPFGAPIGSAAVQTIGRRKLAPVPTTAEELSTTYVVTDNCIKCKYMDCVEVCPVDCFYEGENMLVIHPDECIDCGVCEPECPADAIFTDSTPGLERWLALNAYHASKWPNITIKREPPANANEFDGYFSPEPRRGD